MSNKFVLAVIPAALVFSGGTFAEDVQMKSMVVTATRNPIEEFKAPADISVISRETLETQHYSDLGAVLKDVPGVTIQNYGSSGANYSSNTLMINGSDKIVVLIDGMRANTNGSVSNRFSANELVDLSMVERIEVLRGSSSTLYGSDAQGGVINIITRRVPDGETMTSLKYTGGSNDLGQENFRHAGSKDGFYWALTGQKRNVGNFTDGSGRSIPESVKDETWGGKLGKRFDDGVSYVELDFNRYQSDYMRPDNVGAGSWSPVYGTKDNSRVSLAYVQKLGENATNRLSLFQNKNNLKDNFTNWASRWTMDLTTSGFSDQLTYKTKNQEITGGVDYFQDRVENYYDYYGSYGTKSVSSTAGFIQDAWNFASGWTLTPGVRIDHHSVYGNHTSPSATLNYVSNERTNYYATYKEYFVAPNQYQLFSAMGGTSLKPESGDSVELGVKHQFSALTNATFNFFSRKSKDVIAFVSNGVGPAGGQYQNVANEKTQGINAAFSTRVLKDYSALVGYTHTRIDPQINQNPNRDGQIPRDTVNLDLGYSKDQFSANFITRGVLGRDFRKADTYADKPSSYWIADFVANYEPYKNTKLFARLNNIFDKYYTDRTYYANPAQWYPQPGRNFKMGVEYTF